MNSIFRALILPLIIFIIIIIIGTCGYMFFNHISALDAVHLVVVTIATCGLRPIGAISQTSKLFDIVFIITSVIVMLLVVGQAFSRVLEGEIKGIQNRRHMDKQLEKMKDHYIICGFGRVGARVATELIHNKIPVVIIDSTPASEEKIKETKLPYIIGSISSDEVLKRASIASAKGLAACADSDVENLFVTLSARTLNPKLNIITRASDPANEDKMKRAGANNVISPYLTAGQKMSSMILNPSVAHFLDRVLHDQTLELFFHEVKIPKNSNIEGKSLKDIDLRNKTGVIILAVKHADSTFNLTPDSHTLIHGDDVFVCIGTKAQTENMKELF